jgi:hypothetical protein
MVVMCELAPRSQRRSWASLGVAVLLWESG